MNNSTAFLAYRHTGEKTQDLRVLLSGVRDALAGAGVKAYCTFFDEDEFQDKSLGARQIMEHAFNTIDGKDLLFVLQISDNKSEGMLMEVGYCIAKGISVVVASKSDISSTYLPDMANLTTKWENLEDLRKQIKATDFSGLVS